MSNFIFIDYNVNTDDVFQQLTDHADDWSAVHGYANISGNKATSGFLPLIMGVLKPPFDSIKDSEYQRETPVYKNHTAIRLLLSKYGIKQMSRAAFFGLPPGGQVHRHIDDGRYYLTRDRFHLSIQGEYLYEVDGEEHVIKPGTFFWFNNKKPHSAINISNVDRITFVFDVVHSKHNPQHFVDL